MNKPITPQAERRQTSLQARLREEMQAGIDAANDPDNAGLPELFARRTTIYSDWYMRVCPECKHRFREGDRVRLCPQCGQAYHDDDQYGLHCWRRHFAGENPCTKGGYNPFTETTEPGCDYTWSGTFPDEKTAESGQAAGSRRVGQVTGQFLHGLSVTWKSFGGEQVIEVQPGDRIVGRKCPWCRFEIRVGDRVVKCPCGHCDTYFHDDLFRHLTCWNDWNGSQGHDYCPTTGAKIETPPAADEEDGDGG